MRTLLPIAAFAILLVPMLSLSASDTPTVLSVAPASGAKGVAVDIGKITVKFDQDMMAEAFSIVESPNGETPPLSGQPSYADPRTLVIPLERLTPGKTYAIALNGGLRRNFRSAAGVPLDPYDISFTTAKEKAPAGDGPKVVRTVPENGATGVDASLEAVEVWFSEDMHRGSMSLVRVAGKMKLGYRRDAKPFFDGPRHLVIPVVLLPDTEFGVGINGPGKEGFQSAAGVAASPYVLTFTTAATFTEEDTPAASPVVGRWRLARVGDKRIEPRVPHLFEHHFFADGGWACFTVQEGRKVFLGGGYAYQDGKITLSSGKDVLTLSSLLPEAVVREHMMVDLGEKKIDPDYFWIAEESPEVAVQGNTLRLGPAGRAIYFDPIPDPPPEAFVGTWKSAKGSAINQAMELRKDGSGQGTINERTFKGRWKLGRLSFEFVSEDGFDKVKGDWILVKADAPGAADKLLLSEKDDLLMFERGGGGQPGIVGRWAVQDESGGTAVIEFKADGTYTREFGAMRAGGTWKVVGNTLQIKDNEDGESLTVAFELVGKDTLHLTIEGQKIPFSRVGSEPPNGKLPKELCGKWAAENKQEGSLLLVLFTGTGQAEIYNKTPQGEMHAAGTWKHQPGKVIFHHAKENQDYVFPYQLVDAQTLALEIMGSKVVLVKVSGDPTEK